MATNERDKEVAEVGLAADQHPMIQCQGDKRCRDGIAAMIEKLAQGSGSACASSLLAVNSVQSLIEEEGGGSCDDDPGRQLHCEGGIHAEHSHNRGSIDN